MAINKKELFDKSFQKVSDFAKAISHPARMQIIEMLIESKTCICSSIVDKLPLSQSTVSQHLKELKNAGLIKGEIEGQKVCYCINKEEFNEMVELITNKLQNLVQIIKS
jgi:DNA-binding transcriptional ArsR family regulator